MKIFSLILLQVSDSPNFLSILIAGILITAIFLGIFLLIRSLVLWYWKIDTIVSNQSIQTALLQQQNKLIEQQNNLLAEIKKQAGNNGIDSNTEPLRN